MTPYSGSLVWRSLWQQLGESLIKAATALIDARPHHRDPAHPRQRIKREIPLRKKNFSVYETFWILTSVCKMSETFVISYNLSGLFHFYNR